MALIGESFKSYVKNQINVRQDKLALKNKDNDTLKYITSKTSFLRLTSGVNINEKVARDLGFSEKVDGNKLAQKYVLEAARFKPSETSPPSFTSDVSYRFENPSYGYDSGPDIGFVPPPGLISATVNTLNRGTIREATINLVCHNLYQFKAINVLFLKLKYSLLLEWGHTLYFNNGTTDNNKTTPPSLVLPAEADSLNLSNDFLKGEISSKQILKKIEENRKKSCGNYDAFFGVVKNFTWELLENGSYNVTIIAISQGSVIESLKLNSNLTPNQNIADGNSNIVPMFKKSTLHFILGKINEKIPIGTGGVGGDNFLHGYIGAAGEVGLNSTNIQNFTGVEFNHKKTGDSNSPSTGANNVLTNQEGINVHFPNLKTYVNEGSTSTQRYIKLGTLLRIMESFLLHYDIGKGGNPPIFEIDSGFDIGNDCFTFPRHISTDPLTCLIPFDYKNVSDQPAYYTAYQINTYDRVIQLDNNGNIEYDYIIDDVITQGTTDWPDSSIAKSNIGKSILQDIFNKNGQSINIVGVTKNASTDDDFRIAVSLNGKQYAGGSVAGRFKAIYEIGKETITTQKQAGNVRFMDGSFRRSKYLGRLTHIYVNIGKIIDVLDKNTDDEGTVTIYNFLTELLSEIKYALGGVNKFDLDYNSETNTFSIIDTAVFPIKYSELNKTDIAKFNINLLKDSNNGGGSFITNFSLKSEVFSKIANAIAIGAQDNGRAMIADSTSLSNFNKGLTDRIITKKQNKNSDNKKESQGFDQFKTAIDKYYDYRTKLTSENTTDGISEQDIDLYRSYLVDLFNFDIGTFTKSFNIPGTGFIPLNFQLTMDGLSGIIQYQTFEIDETLLPNEYQNRLGFITTTVSHKIDSKGWETTINSLSVPKKYNKPEKIEEAPLPKREPKSSGNSTTNGTGTRKPMAIYNIKRTPQTITLHYTEDGGGGSAKGTVDYLMGYNHPKAYDWNQRLGIHWAVDRAGNVEAGVDEDRYCVHGDTWSQFGIGIEIASRGKMKAGEPNSVDLGFTYYKYQYYEEYTDLQIAALENLIRDIFSRWSGINQNIQGHNLWEWVFGFHSDTLGKDGKPIPGNTYISLTAGDSDKDKDSEYNYTLEKMGGKGGYLGPKGQNTGGFKTKGGLYSHATGGGTHYDVAPTPKLVAMLVRLGYKDGY